ncbi:MAG: serine hydrolase [Crocinitomicaceae bacterium]|nr:serine hydrolase [Crocinitomicaceae bacterium]|tara:strand:- start:24041 stop:25213 length:1173 start_codon:yes stop_codon:yes gene_type:complete
MNKKTKRILKVAGVLLVLHLILVVTDHTYLYKTIRMTVFKGKLGPSIDEYPAFANRVVENGKPQPWHKAKNYNKKAIPQEHLAELERLESIAYLVIKDDSIVTEEYWDGYNDASYSNSFSMAKSMVSFALGVAISEGKIRSVEDPVCLYLEEYCEGKAAGLTIKDLLTMSSGINFDEHYVNPLAYPAKANYGKDLRELSEEYEVTEDPGKVFIYQSGTTQLIAFLVEKVTGQSLSSYVAEKLWQPMGASHEALWSLDHEEGDEKAFCCFNSNARDFARWGYLALHRGNWKGQQLIDSSYVVDATSPATWLKTQIGSTNMQYGYQWWTFPNYDDKYDLYYMRGILGQYVIVIPEQNMIVVRLGHKREKAGDEHPLDFYHWVNAALEMHANE